MEYVIVVAATAVVVGVLPFVRRAWVNRHRSWLDRCTHERVLVHTVDGQTLDGSLSSVAGDGLLLVAARLVDGDVQVAGEMWVPRARVLFVQRPPSAERS